MPANYLTSITNPAGVMVLQAQFNAEHLLIGLTDANGNAIALNPDPATQSDTATDPLGYERRKRDRSNT